MERAWSGLGEETHRIRITDGCDSDKLEFGGAGCNAGKGEAWRKDGIANRFSILVCAGVMGFAFWEEMVGIAPGSVFRFPEVPGLGDGDYAMSMVGTIGGVIEKEGLRGGRLAVWGGDLARAHDLPFRYRVTADWFLLPGKPVPVVATREEAMSYGYILSPWDLGSRLDGDGYRVEVATEGNFVWLYRVRQAGEGEE